MSPHPHRYSNDDAECTTWLLVDHLHELLDLAATESIVKDFFEHLFQDRTGAHLVLQAMDSRFEESGGGGGSTSSSQLVRRRLNALDTLMGVPVSGNFNISNIYKNFSGLSCLGVKWFWSELRIFRLYCLFPDLEDSNLDLA